MGIISLNKYIGYIQSPPKLVKSIIRMSGFINELVPFIIIAVNVDKSSSQIQMVIILQYEFRFTNFYHYTKILL